MTRGNALNHVPVFEAGDRKRGSPFPTRSTARRDVAFDCQISYLAAVLRGPGGAATPTTSRPDGSSRVLCHVRLRAVRVVPNRGGAAATNKVHAWVSLRLDAPRQNAFLR